MSQRSRELQQLLQLLPLLQLTVEPPVQGVPVEQLIEDAQKLMKAFMDPEVRTYSEGFACGG